MKKAVIFLLPLLFMFQLSHASPARIVGGVKAADNAWPSTVALLRKETIEEEGSNPQANFLAQFCGATLISPTWVLTAAHCVVNDNNQVVAASEMLALVGTNDLSYGGDRLAIKKVIVHPNYASLVSFDSDVALLELASATQVATIAVSANDPATGVFSMAVGWGALTYPDRIFPTALYEVDLPITARTTCDAVHGNAFTSNMMCAGYAEGGKDTCQADSGGPLMVQENGEFKQVGITSWGVGCALAGKYGVYTRLSNFSSWIATNGKSAPTAYAGIDQIVDETNSSDSAIVFLDASLSNDPDGSITSYVWTSNTGVAIPNVESPSADFPVGVHTVSLTVTDNDNLSSTDQVEITVTGHSVTTSSGGSLPFFFIILFSILGLYRFKYVFKKYRGKV